MKTATEKTPDSARLAEDISCLAESGVFSVAVFIWEEPECARTLSSALGIGRFFSEIAYVPPRGDWLQLLSLLKVDVFASGSLERVAAASASGLRSVWISRGLNLGSPLPRVESVRDLLSTLSREIG
ncbi:MAG: hypothetical protein DRO06_05070 [Thermoproteota archaeon]|nr:MAG: hypothetical protein DRO06_05070 [Candidatus Korarchaeota archaeon]